MSEAGNIKILMSYGDVKGDAADSVHKNWVKLDACEFSVSRNVSQDSGNPKRNVGTPEISAISINKIMDPATPGIYLATLSGSGQTCTIHLCQGSDGTNLQVMMEYKLENALFSKYRVNASSGSPHVTETAIISFTTMKTVYTPYDSTGKKGTPLASGYDISGAKLI